MKRKIDLRFSVLSLLIVLAALTRLLPHPPNFTAVGAMGLFGAAYFSRRHLAFILPFAALWISDLFLNNMVYAQMFPEYYQGFTLFGNGWTYAGFFLIVIIGMLMLRKVRLTTVLGASLSASLVFFLITNFGSWIGNPVYPQNLGGLLTAYAMGIPFFWNTLLGDLFYSALLFGVFEWAGTRFPVLRLKSS